MRRGDIGVRTQTVTPILARGLALPRERGVLLADVIPGSARLCRAARRRYGPAGQILDFRFSADGALWAATQGGLSRLKGGSIETLSSKNGLPCEVKSTYWPHRVHFERLGRSRADWRLLCPGPMVDEPALGLDQLRLSIDAVPFQVPPYARALPAPLVLPVFGSLIPQMTVPYADAAALMLANLDRGNAMARRRVGLALPLGVHGQ